MTPQSSSARSVAIGDPDPVPVVGGPDSAVALGVQKRADRAGLAPSWFAAVMGTGGVATAAVSLPRSFTGMHTAALVVWLIAAAVLVAMAAATLGQRAMHLHAHDPMQVQFFGAPAVALLTVGAGTLLLGGDLLGAQTALTIDRVLWILGTALGLATACTVPYLMVTRHRFEPDAAFGGWLMPVVPPLVSATTGALLIQHAPEGQLRLTLTLLCYAMLGLGSVAVLIVLTMVYSRLVHHEAPTGAIVPTVWIGLGALGQIVTALGGLALAAPSVLPAPYPQGAAIFALLGGLAVWGFSVLWMTLAAALTVRTVRAGLPFAPSWWSFIFPVSASVTATSSLAQRTGAELFIWIAVGLYVVLVAAWIVVGGRSLRHLVGYLKGPLGGPTRGARATAPAGN